MRHWVGAVQVVDKPEEEWEMTSEGGEESGEKKLSMREKNDRREKQRKKKKT